MSLIDEVKQVILELITADQNWEKLWQQQGWNFSRTDLETMPSNVLANALLTTPLSINPTIAGFEDFIGDRMITPSQPARSLLYHTLASPNVIAQADGSELKSFPSLSQIDIVENYVFASEPPTLDQLVTKARNILQLSDAAPLELGIAVYASEYRPAAETPHQRYADLCLSRTGIARVGTREEAYTPKQRGFSVFQEGDGIHDLRIVPCRYTTYLAVKAKGRFDRFGPFNSLSESQNDRDLDFWVPLHKIFSGDECIAGLNLKVDLEMHHFNQKLEKLVRRLREQNFSTRSDAELAQPPFRFQDKIASWGDPALYGKGLIVPIPQPLVEAAKRDGVPMTFTVPPMNSEAFRDAFSPTLYLVSSSFGSRPWPEYAHIRERIGINPTNINELPNVVEVANEGGYEAQHYLDYSADGWIMPQVIDQNSGATLAWAGASLPNISAYSLVAAPDFFPNVDQRRLYEWWQQEVPQQAQAGQLPDWWADLVRDGHWERLWRAAPEPLSDERLLPNLQLPNQPFQDDDTTVTSIVTLLQEIDLSLSSPKTPLTARHSYLPDAGAGFFAPGWDTSIDVLDEVHLAAYGLGSPFPEDAKLCAALSTFWPAAAPDTTRTFFTVPFSSGTVCPMTDEELGSINNSVPWDGVVGPKIIDENSNERTVEYPDYPHADYTRNALEGSFSIALSSKITLVEYQRRILAMLRCYRALDKLSEKGSAHILSFRLVESNNAELISAQQQTNTVLNGPIYRFEVFNDTVELVGGGSQSNVSGPLVVNNGKQLQYNVTFCWTLFIGVGQFVLRRWQRGDGSVQRGIWQRRDV